MNIIDITKQIVAEAPEGACYEQSYGNCYYTKGPGGSGRGCLVGQAIIKWCPAMKPYLEAADARLSTSINQIAINLGLNHIFSQEEIDWLLNVQKLQDNGEKWSYCVGDV